MKTAFVCDSALQINKNFANNNPITVIPVEVRLDDEIFEDNVTITPDEFYERIHNGQKPSTSQEHTLLLYKLKNLLMGLKLK